MKHQGFDRTGRQLLGVIRRSVLLLPTGTRIERSATRPSKLIKPAQVKHSVPLHFELSVPALVCVSICPVLQQTQHLVFPLCSMRFQKWVFGFSRGELGPLEQTRRTSHLVMKLVGMADLAVFVRDKRETC